MKKLTKFERRFREIEFMTTHHPTEIYKKLRIVGINKVEAKKYCVFYSQTFYVPLCKMYHNEKEENRLENSV